MGLRLNDGGGNHVELTAPTLTGDVSLTLPNSIGTDGQFLKVGATGNLSFDTIPPASSGPESLTVTSLPIVNAAVVNATSSVSNVPTVVGGFPTYSIASYQWQIQGAGSTNYVDAGTSATLTIPATINDGGTTRDTAGGKIRVRVTMQDSTPGTALTSGFITSLSLDISQPNIALTFPTTGTLAVSSTTAAGFSVVQVNGGADNDNVVHYSYVGNSVGIGCLTVVTNTGNVYANGSSSALSAGMNGPCDFNQTSNYAHAGKTIAGIVSHLNNNIECVVYTDGSVKQKNGSVLHDATVSGKSPCVNYGGQGNHGTPMFILEDGTWMWCGTGTASFQGQTYSIRTPVDIMPGSVKIVRCAAFRNGSSAGSWDGGHGTVAWILLGDDGFLYTAEVVAGQFPSDITDHGTMAAGDAKRLEFNGTTVTNKFLDVGAYSSVGATWSSGYGFSALRDDGQMWVYSNGTFGTTFQQYGSRTNYTTAFHNGGHSHRNGMTGDINSGVAYTTTAGQMAGFDDGSAASAESVLFTPTNISNKSVAASIPMRSNISGVGSVTNQAVHWFIPRS